MGNEICLKVHTKPGDEVICEAGSHILNFESGAAAFLSSIQLIPIQGNLGVLPLEEVRQAIRPPYYYMPNTSLISVENTHNSAGGTIYPLENLKKLYAFAQKNSLNLHMDGARIWNAAIASGTKLSGYALFCDSMSVCFSKGLGAPIGSAIVGSKEFIKEAHRYRKIFGGGMRQVGILAAAVLYALDHNFGRLAEDHQNARHLAQALSELDTVEINLSSVQTNIIVFDIKKAGKDIQHILAELKENNVLLVPFGPTKLRAVTHLDLTSGDIETAIRVFQKVLV
jgi:threonine aldolase